MFRSHLTLALALVCSMLYSTAMAQCNGDEDLCGKRYDKVAYLTTHNAFNSEEGGFNLPNHTYGITRQLQDGVRALMIDVYDVSGFATVYHGFSFLGTASLESQLLEIKTFLDANPNEVVTIIFESYINAAMMNASFSSVGLLGMLHEQSPEDDWPTLQEMIDSGKRLVVLSDDNDAAPGQGWYHYVWDFAVETPFSNNSLSDFNCNFNRGDPENDLFILNHFATDPSLGVGRTDLSLQANQFDFFFNRAVACWNETGKFPNFPTVDFYELGDALQVVDSLNRMPNSVGISSPKSLRFHVGPNPSRTGVFSVESDLSDARYVVFNTNGSRVQSGRLTSSSTIDLSAFPTGVYVLTVTHNSGTRTLKLVNLQNGSRR